MRGHIRKRDDRSWAVVVDVGHDSHTGKRRQKWVSVKGTKRAAERRLAEVVRDLNEGTYVEPSRVTLPDYLDRWIRDSVSISVRERTAQGYRGIVRRLQRDLGRVELAQLKPHHVQRYYAELIGGGVPARERVPAQARQALARRGVRGPDAHGPVGLYRSVMSDGDRAKSRRMREVLRGELGRIASRPSVEAWLHEARARKEASGTRITPATILEARDADRT